MPGKLRHPTVTRRTFVKGTAATGAAIAAAQVFAPAIAQAKPIKIGYVSPATGPLAPFAAADEFMLAQFREATKGGLKVGNATRPIEVLLRDSQSNPNRAAEVAKELIVRDKIDLMLVGNTPETTNPVCTQAEIEEVATISSLAPWQPWFFGQQGNPGQPRAFNYVYHYFWGLEDVIAAFLALWDGAPTNKVVAGLFPNDADGNAWGDKERGLPPALAAAGYRLIDPGRYQQMNNDFSSQIAAFKAAGVEIVTGVMIPPDFSTFWSQAAQQGFKPKVVTIGKALLFPSAINSLGARGDGLTTEIWWSPNHPFKSGLTGQSCKQLADTYVAATKRPWSQPIGFQHALFEVAIDIVKRAKAIEPKAILDSIVATNYQSIVGPVHWAGKPVKNVTKTPLVAGQWQKKGDKFELVITANKPAPNIPTGGKLALLS